MLAATAFAQSGSIATVVVHNSGPSIFDAAGNLYTLGAGPVTPGAAQTYSGGGICETTIGLVTYHPLCPDAYVGKIDAKGTLIFGTLLGGPTYDQATAIALDAAGNVLITGATGGSFPTTAHAAIPASDAATGFAAKISSDGSTVLYSTYLPTTLARPAAITVDPEGNAYIAGTSSDGHARVLKLTADGSTIAFTVPLAGSNQDAATAIALDRAGNIVVAGQTQSPDFPATPGVAQTHLAGTQNVFVTKLTAGGTILFSTFLGGSGADSTNVVRVDSANNIYLAGSTSSLDFPTTSGSFQPRAVVPLWSSRLMTGFVARLQTDGSALLWSTYVMSATATGAPGVTQLAVGPSGDTYAAGVTGAGFPITPTAAQACYQGSLTEGYVVRLDSHGALLDATYAGPGAVEVSGLALTTGGSLLLAWSNGTGMRSDISFGAAGTQAAACLSPTVLNSATMAPDAGGASRVAAGEFITLTGFGLGPDAGQAYQPDSQGRIPTQLAGIQVFFDGQPAPVLYIQSQQINALAPVELAGRTQTTIAVSYHGNIVGSMTVTISPSGEPGIFRAAPGVSTQAAAINQDGTTNSAANPAARGSIVTVWGTGLGLLDPPCATGALNPGVAVNLANGLGVYFTGYTPSGTVPWYVGSAPTMPCGVEQINFPVDTNAPAGLYPLMVWSTKLIANGLQALTVAAAESFIYVK
jgi:uncharacterized protein (TIGR03437 family)